MAFRRLLGLQSFLRGARYSTNRTCQQKADSAAVGTGLGSDGAGSGNNSYVYVVVPATVKFLPASTASGPYPQVPRRHGLPLPGPTATAFLCGMAFTAGLSYLWYSKECLQQWLRFLPSPLSAGGQAHASTAEPYLNSSSYQGFPVPQTKVVQESGAHAMALLRGSIADAAAHVSPAVVHLVLSGQEKVEMSPFVAHRSSGSGFIYDAEGYILTNAHVVEEALNNSKGEQLWVTLEDGRKFSGTVLCMDKPSDIAVVKVDCPGGLPTARLGSSSHLRPGEWVLAVGSPLLLKHSVTAGIVSYVDRKGSEMGLFSAKTSFIQTDAAINSGNSGGPLVNLDGEVIGMNVMKALATSGVSFAIPIDTIKDIVAELRHKGRIIRPYLGITMAEVKGDIFKHMKAKRPDLPDTLERCIVVSKVRVGSPACKAGLRVDDIIVGIGADSVTPTIDRLAEVLKDNISRSVRLTVLRQVADGSYKQHAVDVVPQEAGDKES